MFRSRQRIPNIGCSVWTSPAVDRGAHGFPDLTLGGTIRIYETGAGNRFGPDCVWKIRGIGFARRLRTPVVTFYGGPPTRRYMSEIFFEGNFSVDGAMLGLAHDRRLADLGSGFTLETEIQTTHFFMSRPYSSVGGGLGVRYDTSRWTKQPSSFAVYSGPSYADDSAVSEGKSGRFLEYVAVEFALANILEMHWDGVIRMYHRSGGFGLYGRHTATGSMLGIGLRRRF